MPRLEESFPMGSAVVAEAPVDDAEFGFGNGFSPITEGNVMGYEFVRDDAPRLLIKDHETGKVTKWHPKYVERI